MLNVGRVRHHTTAEGPGVRTAIWVAGCTIRCPGCINPHLFEASGTVMAIAELAEVVVASGDEGITLIGGEPFDQAIQCADLAEQVRASGLGVVTFTGHTREQLTTPDAIRLIAATDLLVDGPYLAAKRETARALVGSENQRFHHITDRYADYDPETVPNRVEVRIEPTGVVGVAGFASRTQLAHLIDMPGRQR